MREFFVGRFHKVSFHHWAGCLFSCFLSFCGTPLKTKKYPLKIDGWKMNFPSNYRSFSVEMLIFRSPDIIKEENNEETKATEHRQVSSPGILGCLVFFPLYPPCRPDCPSGVPRTSWRDARRPCPGCFSGRQGSSNAPGEVLGHHFVWLGFRVSPFFLEQRFIIIQKKAPLFC